jgi:hypothetical protein
VGLALVVRVMKTDPSTEPKPLSEAQLAARRANAKLSTGPGAAGKARTRLNALKHGLTARTPWPGQDARRNLEFFQRAWARLDPRNPLEETCVANLLQSRLQADLFLSVERTVLLRRPVAFTPDDGRLFTFLQDAGGLGTMEQLTRHLAHLTRATEKDLLNLLRVRQENWGERRESVLAETWVEDPGAAEPGGVGAAVPEAATPPVSLGALEDTLADDRLILPGEDEQAYAALARELWATLQPANMLEGFIAHDFIQTQWRCDRSLNIQGVLLDRCAVSATGHHGGLPFGFIADSQGDQALETLRQYDAALRRRLERLMALFRKVRKTGWQEGTPPIRQPPADLQSSASPSSAASGQAAPELTPNSPTTDLVIISGHGDEPPKSSTQPTDIDLADQSTRPKEAT